MPPNMNKDVDIKELKQLHKDEEFVCCVLKGREMLNNYFDDNLVLRILGNCYSALDQFDSAIEFGKKSIIVATDEQKYMSLVTLAFTLYLYGSYKEALILYEEAFEEYEFQLVDKVNCAECLIRIGKYNEAISLLTDPKISKLKQRPVQLYVLGVAYRAIEKYSSALECFQKTLQLSRNENDDYELADIGTKDIVKMMHSKISLVN